ncbi:amino acid transporter AVT1I-like [Cucurbita pepo subsp. pepo]|uniref:amino acid transporter AVT1I-like n=1 Tax=Cucurbita pepo subsp. pepo TaxID=3664 RepID=UPI000C9D3735|nr:amino acid transporter AVT1I-like [Cucurbita pepo subsp. pepo]
METQSQLPSTQLQLKGTTFLRTCINGINALSGVGILSIPFALSQGGWLSLILLSLVAAVCWYTGLLLKRCMDANPSVRTYPDIGWLAFGFKGKIMVSVFVYMELYLVAVEFLILEGDNLQKLFPSSGFKFGSVSVEGKQMYMVLAAVLILPTTCLKSLGLLAYVSFGGVLASVVLVLCVAWVGAVDGVGFNQRDELLKLQGLPTTLSLFLFCYCGHAVFPMLCNSMNNKTQFPKVLMVCFVASTMSYGSMAILGYLMYGENIKSQVTLNLPTHKTSTKIAIYTTLINPITKYAAIINPIAMAIEEASRLFATRSMAILMRTLLLFTTLILALSIPFFAYVMAFTGAFLSVTNCILIPCLCYLKINKSARKFGWELVVIVGILVMGFSVGILGTCSSIKEIVKRL